jgi:homoserine dehydrogenase
VRITLPCSPTRRQLGYAESDPSADVDGYDARAKLCILSRIALHAELDPDSVATQSISTVEAIDFAYAKELNCTIRQVSSAQLDGTLFMRGSRRCWCR